MINYIAILEYNNEDIYNTKERHVFIKNCDSITEATNKLIESIDMKHVKSFKIDTVKSTATIDGNNTVIEIRDGK